MSHPTRVMLALCAALSLAGLAESLLARPGEAPDLLVRGPGHVHAATWTSAAR